MTISKHLETKHDAFKKSMGERGSLNRNKKYFKLNKKHTTIYKKLRHAAQATPRRKFITLNNHIKDIKSPK